jgi:hypothetical protein
MYSEFCYKESQTYCLPTTLRTLYYVYIHPIITHGIIFWGRGSKVTKLFTLQKRIVRIITNKKPRDPCRDAFRNMEILTLYSQYLFSLIVFTVENNHKFTVLLIRTYICIILDTTQIYTYQQLN